MCVSTKCIWNQYNEGIVTVIKHNHSQKSILFKGQMYYIALKKVYKKMPVNIFIINAGVNGSV